MFEAQPFSQTPDDELRYLTVVVAALRKLAADNSYRSKITADLAQDLQTRHHIASPIAEPSREDLQRAGATCHQRIMDWSHTVESNLSNDALAMMSRYNIGPDYAEKPWLKEPLEFRPPEDPANHPKELAFHLKMLELHTVLYAIMQALEPPDEDRLGIC